MVMGVALDISSLPGEARGNAVEGRCLWSLCVAICQVRYGLVPAAKFPTPVAHAGSCLHRHVGVNGAVLLGCQGYVETGSTCALARPFVLTCSYTITHVVIVPPPPPCPPPPPPGADQLTAREAELCSSARLLPIHYLSLKEVMMRDAQVHGHISRFDVSVGGA